ncbi:MAG: NUDIX domain-containing protein [Thaumarchaeota archaeon]|nr:NUDIX domain-containing protein [Nitrososphaerota archaeon]RNJ72539.1 MAG: NUDIX domain-containing protein [Thaumarchaeota archaeon S14]MDD9809394.1 NUDIX domain-containing protein [Nitrososphaerota archaeon]MDD9812736.1 NUDIX domain-containing protein [Nitrososphaerota archaeon]MDD9825621.1 NUDIX domain-containing protein [Nitrososphaerota archaeon]
MARTQRSAGAVIFREDGQRRLYLLLLYPTNHWDFVKGKIEPGESELETLLREAREETGIGDLEVVGGFRREIRYNFAHEGTLIRKRVSFFLARTRTAEVRLSHEHRAHVWEPYPRAMETLTYENARGVLGAAEALLRDERADARGLGPRAGRAED